MYTGGVQSMQKKTDCMLVSVIGCHHLYIILWVSFASSEAASLIFGRLHRNLCMKHWSLFLCPQLSSPSLSQEKKIEKKRKKRKKNKKDRKKRKINLTNIKVQFVPLIVILLNMSCLWWCWHYHTHKTELLHTLEDTLDFVNYIHWIYSTCPLK